MGGLVRLTYWLTQGSGNKITNHLKVDKRPWPGEIRGHGVGYGVDKKTVSAWRATTDAGYRWMYSDGPYFLRRKPDSVRLVWDTQWFVSGSQRRVKSLEEKGCILQDHAPGDVIFVCPSSSMMHGFRDGDTDKAWVDRTIAKLRQHTDRPIEVRRKGAASGIDIRVAEMQPIFDRAWAIVTEGSTIGCEAIAAGVPVFTDRECAASPLAHRDLAEIEEATIKGDRERWAHNLTARQFSSAELRNGRALRVLMEDGGFA